MKGMCRPKRTPVVERLVPIMMVTAHARIAARLIRSLPHLRQPIISPDGPRRWVYIKPRRSYLPESVKPRMACGLAEDSARVGKKLRVPYSLGLVTLLMIGM